MLKSKISAKKMILLLIVVVIIIPITIIYNWSINWIFYYLIDTLGIPYISSISGLSIDTIEWMIITLPFYLKILPIIIFIPIGIIIFIKKKWKK